MKHLLRTMVRRSPIHPTEFQSRNRYLRLCAIAIFVFLANNHNAVAATMVLEPNVWKLASLPANPAGSTIAQLFRTSLDEAEYGETWIIYRFDPSISDYVDPGIDGQLRQGQGFWIIQINSDSINISLPDQITLESSVLASSFCMGDNGCAHTALKNSAGGSTWNIVGAPFEDEIRAVDLRVVSTGEGSACEAGCDLEAAAESEIVMGPVWFYDDSIPTYRDLMETGAGTLQPWAGYWIGLPAMDPAVGELELLIPRAGFGSPFPPPGQLPPEPGDLGKETLEGIDSNNDGLRDDVEIALAGIEYSEEEYQAARQSVIALQNVMLVGGAASAMSVQQAGNRLSQAAECLYETFAEQAVDELSLYEFMVLDTRERLAASRNFDNQSIGRQFSTDVSGGACE